MSAAVTGDQVGVLAQSYLKLLLESDDLFNDITVVTEDQGDIESAMNRALGPWDTKDGARGVCVVVQLPDGGDDSTLTLGPLDLGFTLLVLENRFLNIDTSKGGTGKRAWTVARRIHRILKNHRAGGLGMTFNPVKPKCIRPASKTLQVGENEFIPLVAYEVMFECREADTQAYTKVANPVVSASPAISTATGSPVGTVPATVTLTCATGSASIFYTVNNTCPCSQNSAATLYTAPFSLTEACTLMVRATKSGSLGSDTMAVKFN